MTITYGYQAGLIDSGRNSEWMETIHDTLTEAIEEGIALLTAGPDLIEVWIDRYTYDSEDPRICTPVEPLYASNGRNAWATRRINPIVPKDRS